VLGLLIGGPHGLHELLPGDAPHLAIDAGPITSADYRDGVALACGPEAGAWLHAGRAWQRVPLDAAEGGAGLESRARSGRVAPDGALYLGLEPAEVLVSRGRGASWARVEAVRGLARFDRHVRTPAGASAPYVSALAFTGEGMILGIAGSGAWGTRDGGRSWLRRSEGLDPMIKRLWEHPERGDRLYATTESGFYRTDDAGFTWVQSLNGLDRSHAWDFAVVPGAPDQLLLGTSRRASGLEGALFRSANGGLSWQRAALGEQQDFQRAPLVTRVWDSVDTLFALADGTAWGSHDAGRSWVPLGEGLPVEAHVLVGVL
jgi:photosystem II stability/assembly factor-like uncharacterized protein